MEKTKKYQIGTKEYEEKIIEAKKSIGYINGTNFIEGIEPMSKEEEQAIIRLTLEETTAEEEYNKIINDLGLTHV